MAVKKYFNTKIVLLASVVISVSILMFAWWYYCNYKVEQEYLEARRYAGYINALVEENYATEDYPFVYIKVINDDYPDGALTLLPYLSDLIWTKIQRDSMQGDILAENKNLIKKILCGEMPYIISDSIDATIIRKCVPNETEEYWFNKGIQAYKEHYLDGVMIREDIPSDEYFAVIKRIILTRHTVYRHYGYGDATNL